MTPLDPFLKFYILGVLFQKVHVQCSAATYGQWKLPCKAQLQQGDAIVK